MGRFHVTIIRPDGYLHSDCFFEVAEGVARGLMELGHDVTYAENWIEPGARTIVFGAHLMTRDWAWTLPSTAVVYNLEQLGVSYTPEWYTGLAERVQVWDYTPVNLERWRLVTCVVAPRLVEVGYFPELRRIAPAAEEDIDVLFYGSLTERRKRVLDEVTEAGLRVKAVFGVYGAERDALIARAKVVLNLHAGEGKIFEVVRVSYLLANGKAVVAEESVDFGPLGAAVAVCTQGSVVEVCKLLVADDAARRQLGERGCAVFSRRRQAEILAGVVGRGEGTAR